MAVVESASMLHWRSTSKPSNTPKF